ncbi:MAG: pirin family protein, partial [Verrucomicrobiota bacterium]
PRIPIKTMITHRKSQERGHANHGWLDSHHTFSFGQYYDPAHMGFRFLRVLNEDKIAPASGFPIHPHADMEIFSYVSSGRLAHKDDLGNYAEIHPGKVQLMSAGTGIRHSEFNPSEEESTHLIQVWLLPEKKGLEPNYQELVYPPTDANNQLKLLASPGGDKGSMSIRQQVSIYAGQLEQGAKLTLPLGEHQSGWLQLIHGQAELNDLQLAVGDGAAVEYAGALTLDARESTEFLWFAMA